ncbi:hypothetical protein FCJ59_28030 [Cupriavidus basilensis]|nr:hypothetical protein [Cupriavidus basilensis]
MTSTPLIRPHPQLDECGLGYLARVAHSNGHRLASDLFSLGGFRIPLSELAERLGVEKTILQQLLPPWPKWVEDRWKDTDQCIRRATVLTRIRVCPHCFMDEAYIKAAWSTAFAVTCPKHQVELRDRCDECLTPLTWLSGQFGRCRCGRNFSDMASEAASDWTCEVAARLLPSCDTSQKGLFDVRGSSISTLGSYELTTLLFALGPIVEARPKSRTGAVPGLYDVARARSYVEAAANLLDDWPARFRGVLQRNVEEHAEASSLCQSMGLIYRILYSRALSDTAFDFLRNELRAYALEVWRGRLDRRYRRLGATEAGDILTGKALLEALGLSFNRVRALTSAGELPAVTLRSPHGRPFTYCKRTDVATVKRRLHAQLDLRAAAGFLGLGRRRVRALLEAGHLAGTYSDGRWRIERSELRLLSAQPALRTVPPQLELVTVGHALRYLHLDDRMGSDLLRRVQIGEIRHYGWQSTVRNLATLRVARADIESIHQEAGRRAGLGISAIVAAKELGVKSEVVYQLMDTGLLTSRTVTIGGRQQRLMTSCAMQIFKSQYCSLVQVAKQWNMSPRAALGILLGQQLLPVVGPQSGGCRQYFFRRDVVARASVAK